MPTRDKCAHCGSRSLLQQPYSVFCHNCGFESLNPARSKLDSHPGIILTPNLEKRSFFRDWVYVILALFIAAIVIGIKVFV